MPKATHRRASETKHPRESASSHRENLVTFLVLPCSFSSAPTCFLDNRTDPIAVMKNRQVDLAFCVKHLSMNVPNQLDSVRSS